MHSSEVPHDSSRNDGNTERYTAFGEPRRCDREAQCRSMEQSLHPRENLEGYVENGEETVIDSSTVQGEDVQPVESGLTNFAAISFLIT